MGFWVQVDKFKPDTSNPLLPRTCTTCRQPLGGWALMNALEGRTGDVGMLFRTGSARSGLEPRTAGTGESIFSSTTTYVLSGVVDERPCKLMLLLPRRVFLASRHCGVSTVRTVHVDVSWLERQLAAPVFHPRHTRRRFATEMELAEGCTC